MVAYLLMIRRSACVIISLSEEPGIASWVSLVADCLLVRFEGCCVAGDVFDIFTGLVEEYLQRFGLWMRSCGLFSS